MYTYRHVKNKSGFQYELGTDTVLYLVINHSTGQSEILTGSGTEGKFKRSAVTSLRVVCMLVSIHQEDIDIFQWKLWPACGARGKVRESPMSVGFVLMGTLISAANFMAKHLIVVEIFQTDQLTEQNCLLLINAASMAKKHMNAFVSQEKQLYFHLCDNTQISPKFYGKNMNKRD